MAAVYLSLYVSLPLPISFFFLKEFNFSYGNICISVCEFMHAGAGVYRGQRHWISWSWSYRQLWAIQCRAFKPNLGPLQGQYILLTTKLSSHSFSLLKLLSEFYIYLLLFLMCIQHFPSVYIYLCTTHMSGTFKGQKELLAPLGLKLKMVMSHQTLIFCKSSKCSWPLNHLSSPSTPGFKEKSLLPFKALLCGFKYIVLFSV